MRQRHLYTLCHVFLASFFLFAPTVLASPDVKAFARSHVPRPLDPGKVRRADLSLSLSPTSTSLNPASITSEWRPEASALESANRNNTALQLGQYILTHANDECKATGGGCSMFNYTLTDCLTDSCACEDETTLAAMVCASCQPEENVVKVYNKYLEICKQEGMAQPSDTVVVTVPWLSAQPSPSPGGSVPSGGATISGNVILTVNDLPGVGSTGSDSVPGPSGASGPSQPSPSPSGAAVNVIQTSIIESPSAPTLSPSASVPIQSGQPAGLLMGLYDPNANVQPSFSSALSPGGVSGLPNANLLGLDVLPTASGGSSTAPSSSALRPATSGPASVVMPDPDAIANARVQALGEAAASRSESVSLPFATSSGALSASARPPASLGSATLVSAAEVTLPAGGNTTALEKSTLALNAAIAFFSVKIDPKCDKDCGTWRSLSNTCTQDLCICTDPGVLSASACQQCLGTTTHGTGYQSQMADYSAFAGNCSAEVEGLSPLASKSAAYDIVAAATSRAGTGSPSGVPRSSAIGVTVPAAAANEVVVTKTSAASPVTSLRLHYEVWVTALTGLAVGASVLYAVV